MIDDSAPQREPSTPAHWHAPDCICGKCPIGPGPASPSDPCARCGHRFGVHHPECHYNRPHGEGPTAVCTAGPEGGPCPAFQTILAVGSGAAAVPAWSPPDEIDLIGRVDAKGIRYLGTAKRQVDGTYHCLADVNGALCIVEVRVSGEGHAGASVATPPLSPKRPQPTGDLLETVRSFVTSGAIATPEAKRIAMDALDELARRERVDAVVSDFVFACHASGCDSTLTLTTNFDGEVVVEQPKCPACGGLMVRT